MGRLIIFAAIALAAPFGIDATLGNIAPELPRGISLNAQVAGTALQKTLIALVAWAVLASFNDLWRGSFLRWAIGLVVGFVVLIGTAFALSGALYAARIEAQSEPMTTYVTGYVVAYLSLLALILIGAGGRRATA